MSSVSSFNDLPIVSAIASRKKGKKPTPKFNISTEQELENLAKQHNLDEQEITLIRLIDIQRIGYAQIALMIGGSRQNVEQKYSNLHKRINKLPIKVKR